MEDHPLAVLQVMVLQVVHVEGAWQVQMGMGSSLPVAD